MIMPIPAMPDNLYKFFIILGLTVIIYKKYEFDTFKVESELKSKYVNAQIDSLNVQVEIVEKEMSHLEGLINKFDSSMDSLFKLVSKRSYLQEGDYNLFLKNKNEIDLYHKQSRLSIEKYSLNRKKIDAIIEKNSRIENENNVLKLEFEMEYSSFKISIVMCSIFLAYGIIGLYNIQSIQNEILTRQLGEKDKYYSNCQSCGKKFNSILTNGKRLDGSYNKAFCSECYENEKFIEPDLAFDTLKERTINQYVHRKNPVARWFLISELEKLDRWKINKYS